MIKWLFIIILLLNELQATKPIIPLISQIKRANYILVATATKSCSYCKVNNKAKFKVAEILRGEIHKSNITVIAPSLSFDINKKYILFLQKKDKTFYWINGTTSRLIATDKNLKKVKKILSTKK